MLKILRLRKTFNFYPCNNLNVEIRIASDEFPAEAVKARLLKIDSSHIEYCLDCIDKNTTKVHNVKNYYFRK